jgi:hypothetical protein
MPIGRHIQEQINQANQERDKGFLDSQSLKLPPINEILISALRKACDYPLTFVSIAGLQTYVKETLKNPGLSQLSESEVFELTEFNKTFTWKNSRLLSLLRDKIYAKELKSQTDNYYQL